MSNAESSNFEEVVLNDALRDELVRSGVRASLHSGDRVRLQVIHGHANLGDDADALCAFIGSVDAGPYYASNIDEILKQGFGES